MVSIVFRQIIVMSIFMATGYTLFKLKLITEEGTKSIGNLMVMVVVPCLILGSFCIDYSASKLREFGWSFLIATIAQILAVIAGAVLYKKDTEDNLCTAFGNVAFMGIPLITAALGDGAVFYIVPYIMVFNLIQWNYAVPMLKGEKKKPTFKSLFINPYTLASVTGFLIFVLNLGNKVPDVAVSALNQIAAINGPVAMVLLGTYIAQAGITKIFSKLRQYQVSFVRLVAVPLVTMLIFRFIPCPQDIKLAIGIGACTPVATSLAIYSKLYGGKNGHACLTVALSTLLSIATIPLVIYIYGFLLK